MTTEYKVMYNILLKLVEHEEAMKAKHPILTVYFIQILCAPKLAFLSRLNALQKDAAAAQAAVSEKDATHKICETLFAAETAVSKDLPRTTEGFQSQPKVEFFIGIKEITQLVLARLVVLKAVTVTEIKK